MLKYTPAINLLFGSLLVLPAASGISLQDGFQDTFTAR